MLKSKHILSACTFRLILVLVAKLRTLMYLYYLFRARTTHLYVTPNFKTL